MSLEQNPQDDNTTFLNEVVASFQRQLIDLHTKLAQSEGSIAVLKIQVEYKDQLITNLSKQEIDKENESSE